MATHGWIVTADHVCDGQDIGRHGPSAIAPEVLSDLKAGKGKEWRAKDDDGEVYYHGRYIGPDDERCLSPLDNFAMPNAGATTIEYLELGVWRSV